MTRCVAEPLKAATGVPKSSSSPSPDYNGVDPGPARRHHRHRHHGRFVLCRHLPAGPGSRRPDSDHRSRPTARPATTRSAGCPRGLGHHQTSPTSRARSSASPIPDSTSGYLDSERLARRPISALRSLNSSAKPASAAATENLVLGVLDGTWDVGTTFGSGAGELARRLHLRQPAHHGRQGPARHRTTWSKSVAVADHPERPADGLQQAPGRTRRPRSPPSSRPAGQRLRMLQRFTGWWLHQLRRRRSSRSTRPSSTLVSR